SNAPSNILDLNRVGSNVSAVSNSTDSDGNYLSSLGDACGMMDLNKLELNEQMDNSKMLSMNRLPNVAYDQSTIGMKLSFNKPETGNANSIQNMEIDETMAPNGDDGIVEVQELSKYGSVSSSSSAAAAAEVIASVTTPTPPFLSSSLLLLNENKEAETKDQSNSSTLSHSTNKSSQSRAHKSNPQSSTLDIDPNRIVWVDDKDSLEKAKV
ncbi:hypothetical protein RFI_06067, partial [Reticulomyxa filosa]